MMPACLALSSGSTWMVTTQPSIRVFRAASTRSHISCAAVTVLAQVRRVIALEAVGAVEAHDLRTRTAGAATFIEFHLVVPGVLTVAQAHDMCDRVEAALKLLIEGCVVTIHVEPEDKAKHAGIVVL